MLRNRTVKWGHQSLDFYSFTAFKKIVVPQRLSPPPLPWPSRALPPSRPSGPFQSPLGLRADRYFYCFDRKNIWLSLEGNNSFSWRFQYNQHCYSNQILGVHLAVSRALGSATLGVKEDNVPPLVQLSSLFISCVRSNHDLFTSFWGQKWYLIHPFARQRAALSQSESTNVPALAHLWRHFFPSGDSLMGFSNI